VPKGLVDALSLEHGVQQDSQEFWKLFLHLIERQLELQPQPELRQLINRHYVGRQKYSTRCRNCLQPSDNPSTFYELELPVGQHCKTLENCLESLLAVESLDGNNKYFCSRCQAQHEADRCIVLTQLPDTLNLQLMRLGSGGAETCVSTNTLPLSGLCTTLRRATRKRSPKR
jgi:ubiquitin carboxyl-terminal hydrolase 48